MILVKQHASDICKLYGHYAVKAQKCNVFDADATAITAVWPCLESSSLLQLLFVTTASMDSRVAIAQLQCSVKITAAILQLKLSVLLPSELQVQAVAKTRTVVARVAWQIAHGTHPSQVLVITFTNMASDELKKRLACLLGDGMSAQVQAETIHAMCIRLLL